METVSCTVNGMTCGGCAANVSRYLEKKGMKDVTVTLATGDVSFTAAPGADVRGVLKGIHTLGYEVVMPDETAAPRKRKWSPLAARFVFCLAFTIPLMLHMVLPWHWLHHPWLQFALALPVYVAGMLHFGRSAWGALRNGMANMDVLITLGASAAFIYSLIGTLEQLGDQYLFYETAASIITLVLLGNLLEEKAVRQTTTAITALAELQQAPARLIVGEEPGQIRETDNRALKPGDRVLVNTGDRIPVDGQIYRGEGYVNEAMITGESMPVGKKTGDRVVGGTILEEGNIRVEITATGKDTVLSYIIELVKQAQNSKPPMQQLADRISAVFVPAVVGIALLTFLLSYAAFGIPLQGAMMRSIAVLVIACPCAMGLATPAAVMVGLGRAARKGILIKGAHTLEAFGDIRQVIFDKTGTLTTGRMRISATDTGGLPEAFFRSVVSGLERHSSHPIARAVTAQWEDAGLISLQQVREIKGTGMQAADAEGNEWTLGSWRLLEEAPEGERHSLYLLQNGEPRGWIDLEDELREDAAAVTGYLKAQGVKTILLSGDLREKCEAVARRAGIDEVYAEQSPAQKLQRLEEALRTAPTAMVGDGINDAPALARATIGITLSDSTQAAVQSANVVLLNGRLASLPLALGMGKHTFLTIRQNLFWAFFYNVIAIPVAAFGFLSPILGAAVMGLSDVVLALNSIRLKYKKVI